MKLPPEEIVRRLKVLPSGDFVEVEIDLAKLVEWAAQAAARSSNGRARHYHGMIRAWVRR